MNYTFIIAQFLTILYAIASAKQEAPVVKAMVDYVPTGNPYSRPFHFWGGAMTLLFCMGTSVGLWNVLSGLLCFISCLLWYWVVFDMALNRSYGKGLFYVGETAWIDKLLGKNGGKVKVIICLLLIGAANLIYYFYGR